MGIPEVGTIHFVRGGDISRSPHILPTVPPPILCSFQSPVEIPGVSNIDFLRVAANARRKALGQPELDPLEFYAFVMPKVRSFFFVMPFLSCKFV